MMLLVFLAASPAGATNATSCARRWANSLRRADGGLASSTIKQYFWGSGAHLDGGLNRGEGHGVLSCAQASLVTSKNSILE